MRKPIILAVSLLLLTLSALAQEPFANEIKAFEEMDKTSPPPQNAVLFVGSSSIRLWKTLAEDFPGVKTINRGFGGSQIEDSVRYAERIIIPLHPAKIFFYAGGNDINAGKSPERVFEDFKSFWTKIHAALPQTKVYYISIAPNPARWSQVERIKHVNVDIQAFCPSPLLQFINVFPEMLSSYGKPRPEIFVADQLHMNAAGYAIWTSILKPYVEQN